MRQWSLSVFIEHLCHFTRYLVQPLAVRAHYSLGALDMVGQELDSWILRFLPLPISATMAPFSAAAQH